MDAVILAAGLGKRMGETKPILNIFGIPLIEHTLRRINARNVVIVYHDPRIPQIIRKKGFKVKLVYNPYPERGNGYSLYLAREYIQDDFILVMGDHLFDESFFHEAFIPEKTTLLVGKSTLIDPEEATKVKIRDGKIVDIGKEITSYDYYDTGFFICKPSIFEYAHDLINQQKRVSLSEIIRRIVKIEGVAARITDADWVDIDFPEDLEKAEKIIKKMLTKSEDGLVSRYINRRFSLAITRILSRFNITPNQVSVMSFILAVFSGITFGYGNLIVGGVLAQISSILDGCDGELARLKNMKSRYGAVFDTVLDRYADFIIIAGIIIAHDVNILIPGLFALIGSLQPSYLRARFNYHNPLTSRDVRLFLIFIMGISGLVIPILLIIGVLTNGGVLYSLFKFRKTSSSTSHSSISLSSPRQ
jgi:CDP-L-myo-inositol myo-inositolphosphotransferase